MIWLIAGQVALLARFYKEKRMPDYKKSIESILLGPISLWNVIKLKTK
jgi:hypothetical protein